MEKEEILYIKKTFTITNKLGLHARAAAQFVQLTNKYSAEINVEKEGQQVNGKSIMGIMMLAAACGSQIMVMAHGIDAKELVEALQTLIEGKFGEE